MKKIKVRYLLFLLAFLLDCTLPAVPPAAVPPEISVVPPSIAPSTVQQQFTPILETPSQMPNQPPANTPEFTPTETETNTFTNTPTVTITNTPTLTFTPVPPLPDFDSIVNFGGGGGGGVNPLGYCGVYELSHTVNPPAIYGSAMNLMDSLSERLGAICLRGVKPNTPFTIRIVSPDGGITLGGKFIARGEEIEWEGHSADELSYWGGKGKEKDGLVYGELHVWWPVGFPFGWWNIYAEGDGLQASGTFDNSMQVNADGINRAQELGVSEQDSRSKIIPVYKNGIHRVQASSNGNLKASGSGFIPSTLVYILLYELIGPGEFGIQWSLKFTTTVVADSSGKIFIDLPGPFTPGQGYLLLSTTDVNRMIDGSTGQFNFSDNSIGYDIFDMEKLKVLNSCPGAPLQRMSVNQRGYVCTQSDAVILRQNPNRSGNEITRVDAGVSFAVIGGPSCADNWSWWNVQLDNGTTGWISEGGDATDPYFICPLE